MLSTLLLAVLGLVLAPPASADAPARDRNAARFEVAFLEMRIEHHLPAMRDGLECIEEAEHAQLKRLCQSIVTSQVREINQMQVWLCKWYKKCDFRDPIEG